MIQVGLNLENLFGKRSEDETTVTFAGVLRLPPVVEVLANLRDHRADFKGNERHEGGEVTNLVVLPTIILNQRDTPHGLATGGTMHVDDAFSAADFLQAKQEHRRTREDLRLRVIHVVTVLVGADFGFAEHDANRVSVGAHRDVPDERRRGVVLARVVLLLGAGLTSGVSIAHGVVVWFWFRFGHASPRVGSVVLRQINNTTVVANATGSLLYKKEACCFVGFRITAFHSTTR